MAAQSEDQRDWQRLNKVSIICLVESSAVSAVQCQCSDILLSPAGHM